MSRQPEPQYTQPIDSYQEPQELCDNCNEHFPTSKLPSHYGYCRRNIKRCQRCQELYDINFQDEHEEEYHKMMPCKHCKKAMKANEINTHEDKCEHKPKYCEYCELMVQIDRYDKHVKECESKTQECERCRGLIIKKDYLTHLVGCDGVNEQERKKMEREKERERERERERQMMMQQQQFVKARSYQEHIANQQQKMQMPINREPTMKEREKERKQDEPIPPRNYDLRQFDQRKNNEEDPRRKPEYNANQQPQGHRYETRLQDKKHAQQVNNPTMITSTITRTQDTKQEPRKNEFDTRLNPPNNYYSKHQPQQPQQQPQQQPPQPQPQIPPQPSYNLGFKHNSHQQEPIKRESNRTDDYNRLKDPESKRHVDPPQAPPAVENYRRRQDTKKSYQGYQEILPKREEPKIQPQQQQRQPQAFKTLEEAKLAFQRPSQREVEQASYKSQGEQNVGDPRSKIGIDKGERERERERERVQGYDKYDKDNKERVPKQSEPEGEIYPNGRGRDKDCLNFREPPQKFPIPNDHNLRKQIIPDPTNVSNPSRAPRQPETNYHHFDDEEAQLQAAIMQSIENTHKSNPSKNKVQGLQGLQGQGHYDEEFIGIDLDESMIAKQKAIEEDLERKKGRRR